MEKSPTKKRNYRRKDRTSGDESEEFMDVSSSSINSSGAKIIASMDHEEEDMEDTSENQNESASGSDTEDYSDSDEDEWESETEDETAADSDESDGQSEKCPVCLNRFKDQDVGTPESCDHDFCLLCIQEWSKNVNTCPVDRQVFHLILARHKVGGEIFKKIPVENKQMADDDEEDPTYCEVCGRCDREDRLLLCDGCDLGYHLDCLTPPLQEVPVSEWFCPDCATDNPEELAEVVSEDEDVIHHLRSENAPIQSILRPHRRQIARTRISERVRARISELRGARERRLRRPVVESSSESETSDVGEEEESMEQPSSCSPAKKTPVKRKRKTPKKRSAGKAARRRTKKGGKRRKGRKRRKGKRAKLPAGLKRPQSAFFLFMNEFRKMYTGSETGASVIASLAGEAWKELPNEQRQVYELKYAENKKEFDTQLENVQETRGARTKSLTPISAKKRLAGRLGLSKPPPGRTIPNVKSGSGDKGMEAGIGVKPLSILGGNNDLNDINYDSEEGASSAIKKRGKYSKSALRFSRPIGKAKSDVQIASPKASTSSGGTFDLLGSIMDGQNLLNMPTKDVTITRYGTIQARKPIEIKLKSSIGDSNQISPTKKADTKAEYDPLEPTSDHSDSEKGDDKSTPSAADDNKPKATKHAEPVEYNPDDPTSTADNTANNTEDEDEIKKAQELKVDIIETKETKEDATILDIVNDLNDSVSKSMPRRNSSKPNTPLVKKKVFDMFESDDVDKPKVLEDPAAKAIEDIVNMTRSFEESQNESSKEDDMSMVTDSTKNPKIPRVPGFANTFQSTDTPSKSVLDTTEPEKMETSTESAIDEPAVINETASKVDDEQGSDDDAQDEPNTNDGENDESQSDSDLDVTELEKQKAALMAEIAGIQLSDIPLPDDMPGMEGEIDIPLPEGSAPSLSSSRRSSLSSVSSIEITAFIDRPPIPIVEVVDTGSPMLVHVESRSPSPTYSSSSSSSWSSSSWTSSSRSRSRSRRKRSYSRDRRSHRRSHDRMQRGSDRGRSHRDSEKTRSREDVEREKRHKRREHEAAKERERRSDRERGSDREDDRHRRDREQAEKAERNRKKAEEEKQRERNREKEERQRIRDHEEKSRERREERREREERIREERHRELSAEREKEVERRREKASRRDRSERSREERSLERGERSRDRGERSRERGERSRERGGRERSRERGDRSREERGERSRERAERSRERGERSREERGDRSRDDRSREERSERSREMRGKERTERSRHFSEIEDGEVDLREVLKSRRRDAERERMERTEGREPESRKDRERREREYERIIEEEEKRYRKGKGRERESDSERSRDQERGREKRNRDGERESRSEKSDHSKESRRRSRSRNSSKSGRVSRSRERSLRHRNDLDTSRSDRDERSQNKEDSRGKENRSERGEKSKQSKHEEVERRENGRRENKGKKEDMEYTSEVARSRKDSERSQKDKSREKSAKDKLREYRDDSEGREIEWDTERETLLVKTIRGQVDSPRQKKSKKDTSVDGSKPKEKKDKSKKAAKGSLVGTGPIFEKVLKDTLADKLADPKSDDAKKQKRFKNKEDDLTGDPIDAPPKKKKKTQDGETLDSNGDPKMKKKKKKKDKTKKIKKTKEGATLPIPEELDHRRASDYSPNTPPGSPHVETPRIPGLDLTSRPMSPTKSESNQYASKTYDPFEPTYDDADSPQPKQTKVPSPIFVSNAARVPELESAKPRAENMFDEAAPPATDPASRSIGMGVPPVQFNINVPPPAIPPNPMLMNPMMLNGPPPPIFPQIGGHPPAGPWNNTPNVNNAPPSAVLPSQPSGGAPEPIHQDRPPLEPMQVPQASTARQSTPPKTSSNIVPGLSLYDDVPPPSKPTEETPKTPRKSVERSPKPQSDKISRTPGDKPRQEKITGSKTPVKQKSGPSIDVDISETQKALAQIEQISKLLTAQSQLSKLIQPAKQVLKAKSKQGQENKTIVKSSSKFAKTDSHKKPSVTPSKTRSQKNGGNDITFDVDAVSPSDNDDAQVSFTPPPEPLYQKSKKRPRTNNQDNHKRNSKPSSNKIQKGKITKPAKPAKLFMKKVNDDDIKKTLEKFNDPNNVPSSAVELTKQEKYLKKLNRQERVIEEVKMALKPVYAAKKIGKDEYKEILRKAVPKICHSKSGDINPVKIKILVDAYAEKYSKHRQAGKSTKSGAKV